MRGPFSLGSIPHCRPLHISNLPNDCRSIGVLTELLCPIPSFFLRPDFAVSFFTKAPPPLTPPGADRACPRGRIDSSFFLTTPINLARPSPHSWRIRQRCSSHPTDLFFSLSFSPYEMRGYLLGPPLISGNLALLWLKRVRSPAPPSCVFPVFIMFWYA